MNDHSNSPRQYEFPTGFHMVRCFPVEGESAFAQLFRGEAIWGQVNLTGVDRDALGEARVQGAELEVELFPPPEDGDLDWWTFPLEDVLQQFAGARGWLLENERKRVPAEDEGLTAAGAALDKAAADDPLWQPLANREDQGTG